MKFKPRGCQETSCKQTPSPASEIPEGQEFQIAQQKLPIGARPYPCGPGSSLIPVFTVKTARKVMTLLQLPQEYSKVQIPHETCQQAPESAPAPPGIQGGTDTPEICQQVLDSIHSSCPGNAGRHSYLVQPGSRHHYPVCPGRAENPRYPMKLLSGAWTLPPLYRECRVSPMGLIPAPPASLLDRVLCSSYLGLPTFRGGDYKNR